MPDRDRRTLADRLQSAGLLIASVVIVAAALAPWIRTLWRMIAG
ncbi:hypothetical protein OSH08_05455 [Kaistia geumhonensis]|uniref:Uncharacterized protein n=1 Tax=Kaistia geumhonensis TaxID=410839 RepID=A0ABU0M6C8_9HYPH|nr:hypothetical protein [Kaistia geumhonensis]MCX5478439.1 hypothetical protein [Kaistia geumhonensis]MDQ0516343.1 hypothetical protein [Kaistia geumhonensis]